MVSGDIFYGCFWRIPKDDTESATGVLRNALEADDNVDFYDMLDDLASKHKAQVSFADGDVTVYFGIPMTTVTQATNDFEEMALLRVMDLQNGSLRKDVRAEMTKVMDSIPYAMREVLSPPVFGIAWSSS